MSVASGYSKFKRHIKQDDGTYKLVSHWTNANTVHMDNGSTLQNTIDELDSSDVGLGNVPNVATNDQTPTYAVASSNTALSSGEKLSVAFGKIAKAVSSLISHLADTVSHITSSERKNWNGKLNASSVSTSLASTSTTTALASSAGKNLQDQITSLNSDFTNIQDVTAEKNGTDAVLIENLTKLHQNKYMAIEIRYTHPNIDVSENFAVVRFPDYTFNTPFMLHADVHGKPTYAFYNSNDKYWYVHLTEDIPYKKGNIIRISGIAIVK